MYAFCVWLDNKTGGSGYSGPYDDDSYDAGWFDSWAFHNDGNDHNDNLYWVWNKAVRELLNTLRL